MVSRSREPVRHMQPLRSEQIFDAATDDALFARLSGDLANALGARSGVIHWQDSADDLEEVSYSGHFNDQQMAVFSEHFSDADLWAEAMHEVSAHGRPYNCDALVASRTYEMSRIFNEWVRPMGDDTFHCIGAVLRLGPVTAKFGFHRGRGQGAFDDDEVNLLGYHLGQFRQLVQVRRKLAAASRAEVNAVAAQDAIGYGVFTLSAGGRLLHHNQAADAILRRADGLVLRDGRLTALAPGQRTALVSAIEAAARRGSAGAGALRLPRRDGGHYQLSIVSSHAGGQRQVVLVAHDPNQPDGSVPGRLRALYGLTAAEAEIAVALAAGLCPVRLAELRQTSVGTIRNQIKAVAGKFGCSRQSEIAALVNGLPRLRIA